MLVSIESPSLIRCVEASACRPFEKGVAGDRQRAAAIGEGGRLSLSVAMSHSSLLRGQFCNSKIGGDCILLHDHIELIGSWVVQ